jgi:hypothetical protein
MPALDPIFQYYPEDGFQDIWFHELSALETACLYNYACVTYGDSSSQAIWHTEEEMKAQFPFSSSQLHEVNFSFKPLRIGEETLEGIVIRIENDSVAVDFEGGLTYWNSVRQEVLIRWLQALFQRAPNARIDWAHEGCFDARSERESLLLCSAVERGDA